MYRGKRFIVDMDRANHGVELSDDDDDNDRVVFSSRTFLFFGWNSYDEPEDFRKLTENERALKSWKQNLSNMGWMNTYYIKEVEEAALRGTYEIRKSIEMIHMMLLKLTIEFVGKNFAKATFEDKKLFGLDFTFTAV